MDVILRNGLPLISHNPWQARHAIYEENVKKHGGQFLWVRMKRTNTRGGYQYLTLVHPESLPFLSNFSWRYSPPGGGDTEVPTPTPVDE